MELNREYLPATGVSRLELVLLHGWGCNREIWRPLVTRIRAWANITLLDLPGCAPGMGNKPPSLDQLLQSLGNNVPEEAVYVGWSLGGQLAVEFASRYPERVCGLVTLCTNPCFVAKDSSPGMEPSVLEQFRALYRENPEATLKRFDSLQVAGARRPRPLLRQVRTTRSNAPDEGQSAGLDWLASLDQRDTLSALNLPKLHLFAANDKLVPPECARRVAELGECESIVLDDACHMLPLEAPSTLGDRIRDFLHRHNQLPCSPDTPALLDKSDVAESFSRAARDYDSVATLQRDVGTRLFNSLESIELAPLRILDLGCGTGHFLPQLMGRFPEAQYIGLDLAQGMVGYARQRFVEADQWVVGDAESLPLAAGSVDLVFSSLAIQWCYRPELLFAELARVLRPGGCCAFTSLGPDTLKELRASWAAVDEHQHVNTFLPVGELEAAVGRVPGLRLDLRAETFSMRYQRVRDLLSELKTLGAHNINRQRPSGLTGRRALQGMLDAYESWREDGTLPATYDVFFGVVEKI